MKLLKYILLCSVVCIVLCCFIFALFFGVAGISAITQITFSELIVLLSLCYIFSFAGSQFLIIADQLYASAVR